MRIAKFLFIVFLFSVPSTHTVWGEAIDWATANLCIRAALPIEAAHRTPRGLLHAISLKETGRWSYRDKISFAWPWTVTARGKGTYLPTKEDAIAEVTRLKKLGVSNIDVGCMQINLFYHPNAFGSLEEAFDPNSNTNYAAEFLAKLFDENGSWDLTVERYHSGDQARGRRYRLAVDKLKNTSESIVNSSLNIQMDLQPKLPLAKIRPLEPKNNSTANLNGFYMDRSAKNRKLRKAFLERKAKVLQRWKEMIRKRGHKKVLASPTRSS